MELEVTPRIICFVGGENDENDGLCSTDEGLRLVQVTWLEGTPLLLLPFFRFLCTGVSFFEWVPPFWWFFHQKQPTGQPSLGVQIVQKRYLLSPSGLESRSLSPGLGVSSLSEYFSCFCFG